MNPPIPQRRLARQLLSRTRLRRPDEVVAWLGAVQAQEYEAAKWAIGLRLRRTVAEAEIEQAFSEGRILRTHVMRPTWHFVTAADIAWLLALTAPRVHRVLSSYTRRQELSAATLVRGTAVFERALRDRHYLTRAELRDRLRDAGLTLNGIRLALLTIYAELEGVICSGPRRGRKFTYALVAERAPQALKLPRDEALATLTRRYFSSHGPATIRDFVWWSGLTAADAKRGLEMNLARREEEGGRTYWSIGPTPRVGAARTPALLLPIYDEYLVAYRDRVAVPHPPSAIDADAGGPVTFRHAIVIAGQIAGTWRTKQDLRALSIDLIPTRRITTRERRALGEAVDRYARFTSASVEWSFREQSR
jgi:winged helix DNA-binding protein